jgi:hypothetical protein
MIKFLMVSLGINPQATSEKMLKQTKYSLSNAPPDHYRRFQKPSFLAETFHHDFVGHHFFLTH